MIKFLKQLFKITIKKSTHSELPSMPTPSETCYLGHCKYPKRRYKGE